MYTVFVRWITEMCYSAGMFGYESHAQCWNDAELLMPFFRINMFGFLSAIFQNESECSVLFCSVAHMYIGVLSSLLIGQLLFMLDTGKVRVLFSLFMLDTTFVLLDTAFVLLEFCSACSFDTIARVLIRCYLNFGERSYWTGLFIYDACSWLTLSNEPDHRWVWDTSS